jgi:hypothetical protein
LVTIVKLTKPRKKEKKEKERKNGDPKRTTKRWWTIKQQKQQLNP